MQTLIFSSQQISKAKGFSLMELLIYLALAALFIGGILTLTGEANTDAEVRQTVQDISDIDNAVRSFYGPQRLTTIPTPAQLEGVVAAALPTMGGATAGTIVTHASTDILITAAPIGASTTLYAWPHYWVTYTGMETATCVGMLGTLRGATAVQVTAAVTAPAFTIANGDHRVTSLAFATGVEGFCEANDTASGIYTIHALFRI